MTTAFHLVSHAKLTEDSPLTPAVLELATRSAITAMEVKPVCIHFEDFGDKQSVVSLLDGGHLTAHLDRSKGAIIIDIVLFEQRQCLTNGLFALLDKLKAKRTYMSVATREL